MKNSTIATIALVLFIAWAIITITLTVGGVPGLTDAQNEFAQYASLIITSLMLSIMIAFGGKSDNNGGE